MDDKRIDRRLEEIPSEQMPEVLRLASELYAQDRAAIEQAQQRRELLNAAAEAGLPPEYVERAAARLQAERVAPPPARCRRPRRFALLALGVGLFMVSRGMHRGFVATPAPPLVMSPAAVPIGPCLPIALGPHSTQQLTDSMLATPGNNLVELLAGLPPGSTPQRNLNGIPFRFDAIVLVGPGESSNGDDVRVAVKPEVDGIPIGRKAARLHFLQATHWQARNGTLIGAYLVHYTDGVRVMVPIRYGEDVMDWWTTADRSDSAAQQRVVWTGRNPASSGPIRLFLKSWDNPRPEVPIRSLDMVTGSQPPGHGAPAPFLVGLTVEEAGNSQAPDAEMPPPSEDIPPATSPT